MKRPKSVLLNLRKILALIYREDPWLTVAYFASSVLGALLLYVVYFAYKLMIDQVSMVAAGQTAPVLTLVIVSYLFAEYLSRFVTYTFNNYYFDYVIRAKFQHVLTRMFLAKLAELDFAQLEHGPVRNLIAKVETTYNSRVPDILAKTNAVVFNIAALAFSFLIALRFNPVYFAVLVIISLPIYYLRSKYGNISWASYSLNAPKTNYLSYIKYLYTNFTTLHEIKLYGLNPHFIETTRKLQRDVLADYEKPIRKYSALSTVSFIMVPAAIYFSLVRFIRREGGVSWSIGDFTFFLNTLFTFSGQISSILVNVGSIYENSLYAQDFFRLMEMEPTIFRPEPANKTSCRLPRQISFNNVSFTYPGAMQPSLTDLNLTIRTGENVALVGQNGAGKSTIVKLLLRFFDPTDGSITVDGTDLREIDLHDWYNQVGILFQDFARYFISLRENIQFGKWHTRNDGDMARAFAEAEGTELLKLLPDGYNQILGRWFQGGVELSGGQWQKIAIARAIYRNAPILILDEPTSAIDAEAEANIFSNLIELYHRKTLLFISHRFSTVRNADRILVMHKGGLVEDGSHDELLAAKNLYAHYFRLQRKGYE